MQMILTKMVKNNKAFSLIELSIVLIIIGLLIAGITGGTSLIESAKIRNVVREIIGWKQTINVFYSLNGRLPGDLNKDNIIGNEVIDKNTFKFPYDGTDTKNNHYIPNNLNVPFVDMYLKKIINFEPKGEPKTASDLKDLKYFPKSESMNFFYFFYYLTLKNVRDDEKHIFEGFDNINFLCFRYQYDTPYKNEIKNGAKYFYNIDKKIDDGRYNDGKMRSKCNRKNSHFNQKKDYEETIQTGGICEIAHIILDSF